MNSILRITLLGMALFAALHHRAQTVAFVVLDEHKIDAFHRKMIEALHVPVRAPHKWGCSYEVLELKARTARQRGLPQRSLVRVSHVEAQSPAAVAGLLKDDLLLAVDGQAVSPRNYKVRMASMPAGTPVPITVVRNGQRITTTITTDRPVRVLPVAHPELLDPFTDNQGRLDRAQLAYLRGLGADHAMLLGTHHLRSHGKVAVPFRDELVTSYNRDQLSSVQYTATYHVVDLRDGRTRPLPLSVITAQPGCNTSDWSTCSDLPTFVHDLLAFVRDSAPTPADSLPAADIEAARPTLMVLPLRAQEGDLVGGTFQPTHEERLLMAALKDRLEDHGYATVGFEGTLRRIQAERLLQNGAPADVRALMLDAARADLLLEFGTLPGEGCTRDVEFRVRNEATARDVASDIRRFNTCNGPDSYKAVVADVLHGGVLLKLDAELRAMRTHGRRVAVLVELDPAATHQLGTVVNGQPLARHVEQAVQQRALRGDYSLAGAVDRTMRFSGVAIPLLAADGSAYTPHAFALDLAADLHARTGLGVRATAIGATVTVVVE
jgi:hypothetical protein